LRWLVVLALLMGACTDWLEVDDGEDDSELVLPAGRPLVMPSAPPESGSRGPIVPATPGLRVPLAGYWLRARLDVADVLLPYTWASLSRGDERAYLRIEAATSATDEPGPGATQELRAVIPIALPGGAELDSLDGLTLKAQALAAATVSMRSSPSDTWSIELERLTLTEVQSNLIVGTLEGQARRGTRGQRTRRFEAGFIALRAPEPSAPTPATDDEVIPPPVDH